MAYEKVGVAYPISEDAADGPFVASATTTHEPEIIWTGLTHRGRRSGGVEHSETNDGAAFNLSDAARRITWNDPFYENNPDIIAAFDINTEKLRVTYVGQQSCASFLIALSLFNLFVFAVESGWSYGLFLWMINLFMSIAWLAGLQGKIDMLGRRHVAVARCGVYLDEADEPGGTTLAKRTILKFDSIASCRVHDAFEPTFYSVVIVARNANKSTTADEEVVPEHIVTGIMNGQAFVDLVSAMMERAKQNAGPSPTDSVRDMTSVEIV
jgi:hypothetical protein